MKTQIKFSDRTISILKACATMQDKLVLTEGSIIRCMTSNKAALLQANIEEYIPNDFGVDLTLLLKHLDADTPVTFSVAGGELRMILNKDRETVSFRSIPFKDIFIPPKKNIRLDQAAPEKLLLTGDDHRYVFGKSCKGGRKLYFFSEGVGEPIQLDIVTSDYMLDETSVRTIKLDHKCFATQAFRATFKEDNLRMIRAANYEVEIYSAGVALFHEENSNIKIWVAIEANQSEFSKKTQTAA